MNTNTTTTAKTFDEAYPLRVSRTTTGVVHAATEVTINDRPVLVKACGFDSSTGATRYAATASTDRPVTCKKCLVVVDRYAAAAAEQAATAAAELADEARAANVAAAARIQTVNVSDADPITLEVHDLLRADRIPFTVSPNRWHGLDLATPYQIIRLAMEDEAYVRLYVFDNHRGEPGALSADAHFANMPAKVIAAAVAAYLTA